MIDETKKELKRDERLLDLVRYQRAELHDACLITDEEYAALASEQGSVERLHNYDDLRAQLDAVTKERDAEAELLDWIQSDGIIHRSKNGSYFVSNVKTGAHAEATTLRAAIRLAIAAEKEKQ